MRSCALEFIYTYMAYKNRSPMNEVHSTYCVAVYLWLTEYVRFIWRGCNAFYDRQIKAMLDETHVHKMKQSGWVRQTHGIYLLQNLVLLGYLNSLSSGWQSITESSGARRLNSQTQTLMKAYLETFVCQIDCGSEITCIEQIQLRIQMIQWNICISISWIWLENSTLLHFYNPVKYHICNCMYLSLL